MLDMVVPDIEQLFEDSNWDGFVVWFKCEAEVVGNKFETPELL